MGKYSFTEKYKELKSTPFFVFVSRDVLDMNDIREQRNRLCELLHIKAPVFVRVRKIGSFQPIKMLCPPRSNIYILVI